MYIFYNVPQSLNVKRERKKHTDEKRKEKKTYPATVWICFFGFDYHARTPSDS